jgi:membrane protease YdiL (CAAX protease family)
LTPYLQDGYPPWVGLVDVAVVTPFAEELLFRGLVQPKLAQLIRPTEALIVQAALFSALHLSPVILVTHFAMGLALGWLRRRSGSLLPGIGLHGAWNYWVAE